MHRYRYGGGGNDVEKLEHELRALALPGQKIVVVPTLQSMADHPAIAMALFVLAPIMRITRASMMSVLTSDFIRTCSAAGFGWWTTYIRYGLRNALLPVLTTIGLVTSFLIGANVVVEKLFSWPGVGSYALGALLATDYAPVQGYILLMALLFVLINTAIDVLNALVDPRMRGR